MIDDRHAEWRRFIRDGVGAGDIDPTREMFLDLIEAGGIYVDFDARTGHNHGTKFRLRPAAENGLCQQHIIV